MLIPEYPESYGIYYAGIKIPSWLPDALDCNTNDEFFALYAEGDWYDGIADGMADSQLIQLLFHKVGSIRKSECLLFRQKNNSWGGYIGDGIRISSWMELRLGDDPYQQNFIEYESLSESEILEADKHDEWLSMNRKHIKKRMKIYLDNI